MGKIAGLVMLANGDPQGAALLSHHRGAAQAINLAGSLGAKPDAAPPGGAAGAPATEPAPGTVPGASFNGLPPAPRFELPSGGNAAAYVLPQLQMQQNGAVTPGQAALIKMHSP